MVVCNRVKMAFALARLLKLQKSYYSSLLTPLTKIRPESVRELTEDAATDSVRSRFEENTANGRCLNEVRLLGYVGNNPERHNTDADSFTSFTLDTHRYFKNEGELMKRTISHNVIMKSPALQNFVEQRVIKGSRVFVGGYLSYNTIDGTDSPKPCVMVDELIFIRK